VSGKSGNARQGRRCGMEGGDRQAGKLRRAPTRDVSAMAGSSQQLQGHGPSGPGPRSGNAAMSGPTK
jgi:hypothetical protein